MQNSWKTKIFPFILYIFDIYIERVLIYKVYSISYVKI